jgi:4'-phosphopantetheinyl transferase
MAVAGARRDRRLTHVALRIALERRIGHGVRGAPLVRSASGEPSLPNCGANFSIAHTHGLAVVAISATGPIGIDIETTRLVRMPALRRAPIEQEAIRLAAGAPLSGRNDDERFLRAWVRIEAVAKARGTGVGPLLETVRPRSVVEQSPHALNPAAATAADITAHDLATAPGTYVAVAFSGSGLPPQLVPFPAESDAIEALIRPS